MSAQRTVDQLDPVECRDIVSAVSKILWFDFETNEFDPDKEWTAETIELVAAVLEDHGLRPAEAEPMG